MIEWFVHPERVASPRQAAALVRALGIDRVRMTQHRTRSWVIKDPPTLQRVLGAVEPGTHTEVEFEGITREATLPLLQRMVAGGAHFLSIAGNGSWLRVWPERDEAFVDERECPRELAFDRFRPAATLTWINANVSAPGPDVVAVLPQLVAELDQVEVEIDLDVALDTALALVEELPAAELEWTGGAVIQFPAGDIMTYKIHPPAGFEAEWRDRIASALSKIR
jgi:hypothetical protein